MRVDLSHTEGIEQVAPNQFRRIEAGYPITIERNIYLVLKVSPCVSVPAPDGKPDWIVGRLFLHKLTPSGAYSKSKKAFCSANITVSGRVLPNLHVVADISQQYWGPVQQYNHVVRSGRETRFIRHRAFDRSLEDGLKAEKRLEASRTWDNWYSDGGAPND